MAQHYSTPSAIQIVDFNLFYGQAFYDLNHEWISKYFVMEDADVKSLSDPQGYIINKGGHILMALFNGEPVGTCALLKDGEGVFELAKMAVAPKMQGMKIGKMLGEAAIDWARRAGAHKVYLVSNRRLQTALNLYERLGFVEVPLPASIYERADIKMELELQPAK
ncbi:acetyltransferase (GNAT) family protein [Pontibacter ummariensis]|uniref:Acetyltransferase (GNAT) family protein n=1 Tax=Pontibacter ummariensis TaxID=1610492 RepID=A0A239KCC0_9BACT|nr:GNAT family N-acetyltransferase [Pontibacter ummariensis]PRY06063.1 acetyltransferase (GNAT) family protein [Pontibacter ummariensis]SNT14764.1 Acetyltransferase (GNAT) family protein [Pontibacter ummariensis]